VPHEFLTQKPSRYDSDSKLPKLHPKVIYELVNSLTNRKPVKVDQNSFLFGINDEDMNNFNLNSFEEKGVYSRNTNYNNKNLDTNSLSLENKALLKPRKFVVHLSQVKCLKKKNI
jgi:hypothetical protein